MRKILLSGCALLLAACSGSGAFTEQSTSSSSTTSTSNEPLADLSGFTAPPSPEQPGGEPVVAGWEGRYSFTFTPVTEFASDGGACSERKGTLELSNYAFSGTATDAYGSTNVLQGRLNAKGQFSADLLDLARNLEGVLAGQFSGLKAEGRWNDRYGCAGTFVFNRIGEIKT